ncbi:MAG: LacI family DNA-binding transcriptional regulator [Anaerolineae bacterium]|nr:LacI family DNA-binding transcriptional regulator [Anaerolineae bacterium]
MAKHVTLKQVAEAAGVSVQTVSRVVNGRPDVADETRERVQQEIQRLGYQRQGRPGVAGHAGQRTLGLVTCPINDEYRSAVITGAEREARRRGYLLILSVTSGSPDEVPTVCDLLLAQQTAGILLFVPSPISGRSLVCPVPLVTLAYPVDSPLAVNVDVNNIEGAYMAVRHLTELGHRRIGVVAGPTGWKAAADRVEGARRAMAEVGRELDASWTRHAQDWALDSGSTAATSLLERHPELTALFCHSDMLALGAYRALRERERVIPDDVSVVGYDDLPLCGYVSPPLTSVSQPKEGLGQMLVQFLIDAVEHGALSEHDVLLTPTLVERQSTCVAHQHAATRGVVRTSPD